MTTRTPAGHEPRRVLVVEDDPGTRDLVRYRLEEAGYLADGVGTAGEALRRCRRVRPDAVVLDLGLPDMTGFDLFARLRRRQGRLPTVFLTSRTLDEDFEQALRLGGQYLAKPLVTPLLLEAVETSLAE